MAMFLMAYAVKQGRPLPPHINIINDIAEGVAGAVTGQRVYSLHMLYADDLTLLTNEPRAMLSGPTINCHQGPVSGQACKLPDLHSPFSYSDGGGDLQYPVPKWFLFLIQCGEMVFTAGVVISFFLVLMSPMLCKVMLRSRLAV